MNYITPHPHHGIPHSIVFAKELASLPENCDSGPLLMESTGLTMFFTILKLLA